MPDIYRFPAVYDRIATGAFPGDIAFYVEAVRGVESVLELGCGTGRVTLPMAQAGAQVVAVDSSGPMLDALRERLRGERRDVRSRVSVVQQDFRVLHDVGVHPRVVIPFHGLAHCDTVSDAQALFHRIHHVLEPGGLLVFDLLQQAGVEHLAEVGHPDGHLDRVRGRVTFRYVDGLSTTLRLFTPDTLLDMLDEARLECRATAGDFSGGPLRQDSPTCIIVAAKRGAR